MKQILWLTALVVVMNTLYHYVPTFTIILGGILFIYAIHDSFG